MRAHITSTPGSTDVVIPGADFQEVCTHMYVLSVWVQVYKVRTQLVEAEAHSQTSHEKLTVLEPQLALLTQQLAASAHARSSAEEDAELAREGSGKMLKQVCKIRSCWCAAYCRPWDAHGPNGVTLLEVYVPRGSNSFTSQLHQTSTGTDHPRPCAAWLCRYFVVMNGVGRFWLCRWLGQGCVHAASVLKLDSQSGRGSFGGQFGRV